MTTVRRVSAVGGIVLLAAVFTCAYVLGEPAREANQFKPGESGILKDADGTPAPSRFADTPLILYQPKDGPVDFALQVQPALPPAPARPRDLVVLVDTTASQAGGHLIAAEKLVEAFVGKLGDGDRVSLRTVNVKSADLSR